MDSFRVLVPQDNQVVSFYFLVKIRKARDKPHLPMPNLKVKLEGFTILKTINIVDIVLGKLQSELLVKGIYTTNNPKYIGGALVRQTLKWCRILVSKSLIGIVTPPLQ